MDDQFLQKVLEKIEARLAELQPAIEEARKLRAMLAAYQGNGAQMRKPIAERKAEIIKYVKAHPGCRVIDVAREQGVSVPRVIQIVNILEREGAIKRTERANRNETGLKAPS